MAKLTIPEPALVVLIGPSGAGKSTFARKHFRPTEVVSSDFCRALVSDDESNQAASAAAFEVLHLITEKRLAAGRLTVVDATNVQPDARQPLRQLSRRYHVPLVAIVFDIPEAVCQEQNLKRPDRQVPTKVIHDHCVLMPRLLAQLRDEHFPHVHVLSSPQEIAAAEVERTRLACNRRDEHGPFDVVGDVHGCFEELVALLGRLGYQMTAAAVTPPPGRKLVFVGDLVDRGPATPAVLRLVMSMVEAGTALGVIGNHDDKLLRKLRGSEVTVAFGLAQSLAQLEQEPAEFVERVKAFLGALPSHLVLDDGRLVVAHAGMPEPLQGRSSRRVRDFALYGETSGETDEFGLPVRYNWAAEYHGKAMVVYGHTPVPEPEWLNRTINIDTGCVFGGKLTALRYPELELVSVPALRTYCPPARPL
jgi:protein phosphatase